MRDGYNPNRRRPLPKPSDVVQAVITHLPNQEEYHSQRFDIVRLSLLSMREHAGVENLPIYIFDNGSCDVLKEWLFYEFKPDTLVLSENVGKWSARAAIFRSHRPETVVGMADDDMFYYPNWLKPQLKILMGVKGTGIVSGYPVRTAGRWGINTTLKWAEEVDGVKLDQGRFLPEQWERDYAKSIGRDEDFHIDDYTKKDVDWRITYQGFKMYAMGHHCQFLTIASIMLHLAVFTNQATSKEREFDEAIDKMGFLRFSTIDRLTRHMGNILDPDLKSEMDRIVYGIEPTKQEPQSTNKKKRKRKRKVKA